MDIKALKMTVKNQQNLIRELKDYLKLQESIVHSLLGYIACLKDELKKTVNN